MPAYTIHLDHDMFQAKPDGALAEMVLVPEKFNIWAFSLGPLWMVYHRLWLALIGWIVLMVAITISGIFLKIPGPAILIITYAAAFLLGLEGNNLRRNKLEAHGFSAIDVSNGKNPKEAELRFLTRLDHSHVEPVSAYANPLGRMAIVPILPEQISGLFAPGGKL